MARTRAASGENLVRLADDSNRQLYIVTWSALVLLTLALHVAFDGMRFSDSPAYVVLIDTTYYFTPEDWFVFEPLSKILFLVARDLTGNVEASVAWGHYFISVVFFLGCLAVFPPSEGNWRGLLIAFALLGPQLAFVTIRATPAYMLAAIAVLEAVRGRYRCFAWLGGAVLFHVSSVLALVSILALLFRSRFRAVQRLQDPKTLLGLLFAMSVAFILAGPIIFSLAETLLSAVPFLSKYTVFLVGLSEGGGMEALQGSSIGHFVFFLAITMFFLAYVVVRDPITRSSAILVIAGYVVYSFMFFAFSPIAAFRQTPFWLLPAFTLFPWHAVGWKGIGQIGFLGMATGIFAFQFSRVLI